MCFHKLTFESLYSGFVWRHAICPRPPVSNSNQVCASCTPNGFHHGDRTKADSWAGGRQIFPHSDRDWFYVALHRNPADGPGLVFYWCSCFRETANSFTFWREWEKNRDEALWINTEHCSRNQRQFCGTCGWTMGHVYSAVKCQSINSKLHNMLKPLRCITTSLYTTDLTPPTVSNGHKYKLQQRKILARKTLYPVRLCASQLLGYGLFVLWRLQVHLMLTVANSVIIL